MREAVAQKEIRTYDIFTAVHKYADDSDYICYINSDIILIGDFSKTVLKFRENYPTQDKLLLVGQRWDWKAPEKIDFDDKNWESTLKEKALSNGKMHAITGTDYFVHTKTTYPFIYPFAIGKGWWDMWLVGNAYRRKDVMTVDTTSTNFVIHQDGPWYQYGKPQKSFASVLRTKEALKNRSFDNYFSDIAKGTRFKTKTNQDGNIEFIRK